MRKSAGQSRLSSGPCDRASQPWGRGLILVAEGDEACREWAKETLENEGYAVLAPAGAVRFMELMVRYRASIRVVVCGKRVAGNTRRNLVQLVRDNMNRDIPIAIRVEGQALSGHDPVIRRSDALLTFPFNTAQLIVTVDELFQRRGDDAPIDRNVSRNEAASDTTSLGIAEYTRS